MGEERRSLGYNPLDPRDRIERGRERAAWFRRADMMGAVTLAMAVFILLAIFRKELALAYLLAMMFLPLLISLALVLLNAVARRGGRTEPVPKRPAPLMLVAISTGLFIVLADPVSLAGLAGALSTLVLGWCVARRQTPEAADHG
jgi:hypothetical protein